MASCPWCKAAVDDTGGACPRCGRRGDEAPVLPGVVDVPDLDIPARPAKGGAKAAPAPARQAPPPDRSSPELDAPAAAARAAAPAQRPPPGLQQGSGILADASSRFEDDDDMMGGSLDLDLSHGPPLVSPGGAPARPSVTGPAASPATSGAASSLQAQVQAQAQQAQAAARAAPGAKAARVPGGDVDPYDGASALRVARSAPEARALADYGEPPPEWWRTPFYAYRVLRRRQELKKVAAQKKREADRAQGAAEDALLAFAERIRPEAERLATYGTAFDEVRGTEAVLRERDAVLASETDAHRQRQAECDAKIAELEVELGKIQVEERQIAGELNEADTLLKRAEARFKRVEIEIRNLVAQSSDEGGTDTKGAGP